MNPIESHREVCRQCYRRGFIAGDCPACWGWGVVVIHTLTKDYGPPHAAGTGKE